MGYLTSAAPSGQQRLLEEWVLRLDNVQVCILIFEGPLALRWILLTAQMDASLSQVSEETAWGLWLSTWNGSCVLPKDRELPALSLPLFLPSLISPHLRLGASPFPSHPTHHPFLSLAGQFLNLSSEMVHLSHLMGRYSLEQTLAWTAKVYEAS